MLGWGGIKIRVCRDGEGRQLSNLLLLPAVQGLQGKSGMNQAENHG